MSGSADNVPSRHAEVLNALLERGFSYERGSVYWEDHGAKVLLASHIRVLGRAMDTSGAIDGVLVKVGPKGRRVICHLQHQALQEGPALAKGLAAKGVVVPLESRRQRALGTFIYELASASVYRLLDRDGIHQISDESGSYFVAAVGSQVFAPDGADFKGVRLGSSVPLASGDLATWKAGMKEILGGNPLVLFTVLAGLSAPMTPLFGRQPTSGVFTGPSGVGKSSLMKVARGLSASSHQLSRWTGSRAGIEALAAAHCDSTLILDELGTSSPADLGEKIYSISEGAGTARATSTGELRQQAVIRCGLLATGEVSKAEHMRGRHSELRDGQEARLPTIRVREKFGVISEVPTGFADSAQVIQHMLTVSELNAGVVYAAFVKVLIERQSKIANVIKARAEEHELKLLNLLQPGDLTTVERRVLGAFVTASLVGSLASHFDILPITSRHALLSAAYVYRLWLDDWREGAGAGASRHLEAVRAWFQKYARTALCDLADWDKPAARSCIGYVHVHKTEGPIFLIRVAAMRDEVCKDADLEQVLDSLEQADLLVKQAKGRQWLQRMPGVPKDAAASRMRFYAIRADILFDK